MALLVYLGNRRDDRDENAVSLENLERSLLRLSADRIKDQINFLQHVFESLHSIVHDFLYAQAPDKLDIARASSRDDMKSGPFGQLCGVCTDVARGLHECVRFARSPLGRARRASGRPWPGQVRIEWVNTNHEVFHGQSKTVTFTVLKGTSRSHSR